MDQRFTRHPLYWQVADVLAERIAKGIWKPGTIIPNEVELARELGVSTGTMRKALDRLEASHLVVRRQGRGTFVEDQTSTAHSQRFELLRNGSGEALATTSSVLCQELGPASELERAQLSLEPRDKVLRTVRLRMQAGRPYMHETAVLVASRFPGLTQEDTGDYVLAALGQKHGVILGQAVEQLTLCGAGEEAADALEIGAEAVLVRLDRIVSSFAGDPLEWRIGFCPLRNEKYVVTIS
jgi:GntR family transcriptional regulator